MPTFGVISRVLNRRVHLGIWRRYLDINGRFNEWKLPLVTTAVDVQISLRDVKTVYILLKKKIHIHDFVNRKFRKVGRRAQGVSTSLGETVLKTNYM